MACGWSMHRGSDVSAAYRKLMREETPGEELSRAWIWEYVLKFTTDASLIKELMGSLPFPDNVPLLKQMVVLKELSSQVSKGLDMEKTIHSLEGFSELLEQASREDRKDVTLSEHGEGIREWMKSSRQLAAHHSLARKIGRVRSKDVGKGEPDVEIEQNRLMQSTEEVIYELRQILGDTGAHQDVGGNSKHGEFRCKVKDFIERAWKEIGTIYLEKIEVDVAKGVDKADVAIVWHSEVDTLNPNAAEKVVQNLEQGRKGLLESSAQLLAVKDPLPATQIRGGQTIQPSGKRSLLDPHPSAEAYHWDEDEISESPDDNSPSASRRVSLPVINIPYRMSSIVGIQPGKSPSRGQQKRRKQHRWSNDEVAILKREVQKYGKGRWKMILQSNQAVFQERTEVDLKDKWRNLEKYEGMLRDDWG